MPRNYAAKHTRRTSSKRFQRYLAPTDFDGRRQQRWYRQNHHVHLMTLAAEQLEPDRMNGLTLILYQIALERFYQTNNPHEMAAFTNLSIRDSTGRTHLLETNPSVLRLLHQTEIENGS